MEIARFIEQQNQSPTKEWTLDVQWPSEVSDDFINKLDLQTTFPDSASIIPYLFQTLRTLQGNSFLEASIDDLTFHRQTATATFHVGTSYEWGILENANVESAFLEQVGYREKLYQKKPFNYTEIVDLQERLLEYAENHGYPFAAVWLGNIQIDSNVIHASLYMKKGRLILVDDIQVNGQVKISDAYLQNYLGLKKGSFYDKSKILKIKNRLRELPFVSETRGATVNFQGQDATINLHLKKKKASRFDFLIGILPGGQGNNPQREREQSFLLTGTFDAEMYNQLGLGERIFASFERLRPETQELELAFTYPYILQTPFGADVRFNQYRRDSTYSDVIFDFGVQYLFEGGNYLKAFFNTTNSNLLSVDTVRIKNGNPPVNLDARNNFYGLEFLLQKLDYRFNPRKGWSAFFRGAAGFKRIPENGLITAVDENFYDTLNTNTFQFRVESDLAYYLPIAQNATIKTSLRSGFIYSELPIYQNEQFRIGGNQLLRGFDEESIFATLYSVLTIEARLLVGQNSFFYLFGDIGYVEDETPNIRRFDRPYGMGLGLTFETSVGIFGLSVAAGSQQGNPLDFGNPKIHFGYVNFF